MILELLPEPVLRCGIRRLLAQRLRRERRRADPAAIDVDLSQGPITLVPEATNRQHYEVPAEFFQLVFGSHLMNSGAYWPEGVATLDGAEEAMLELVRSRLQLADGQRVLELGCGWGALSLWIAQHYPNSRVLAVSSSRTQHDFLEARRPQNLEIIAADMSTLAIDTRFDRVVSIEMFEQMHNWRELLHRIEGWLEPGGKLFVHLFCHRRYAYPLEADGVGNWLGRYFFTGGLMPSLDLLPRLMGGLLLEKSWEVGGEHYAKTSEAWGRNLAAHRSVALPVLEQVYGEAAPVWFQRWRIHFLACAELFAYRGGTEWLVGHYRLRKP